MATPLTEITKEELKEIIATTVEEKLLELVGDPDEGLPIRQALRNRLRRQKSAVARGERGEPFAEVARRLELA